jgi:dienelactone hydrolase
MGVAVFILDSFTGRGLYKVNNDQSQLGRLTAIVDAYRALDLLVQHKHIDAARIALMGFSRGGQVTLYASLKRFQQLHGSGSGHEFAAYIPFYPSCITHYKGDEDIASKPVRIFHGSADNYNPVATCRTYVERLRKNGKDVVLHEYAGAHHVFDYKKLTKPVILAEAQTTRACTLEENKDGIIVNTQSGKKFTYSDPCVEHGPTIAFNQDAYDKAKQTLHDFIRTIFLTVNQPKMK